MKLVHTVCICTIQTKQEEVASIKLHSTLLHTSGQNMHIKQLTTNNMVNRQLWNVLRMYEYMQETYHLSGGL